MPENYATADPNESVLQSLRSSEFYDYLIKVLLIGDSGVGIDFKVKFLVIDGLKVKLQIWDTAGQERFRTITQAYYRSAMGVLIVYDQSNPGSFDNARSWLEQIDLHAATDIGKMLLGNKCDLPDLTPPGGAEALANEFGIEWQRASAKTGMGVEEAFLKLTRRIITRLKTDAARTQQADECHGNVKLRAQTLVAYERLSFDHGSSKGRCPC